MKSPKTLIAAAAVPLVAAGAVGISSVAVGAAPAHAAPDAKSSLSCKFRLYAPYWVKSANGKRFVGAKFSVSECTGDLAATYHVTATLTPPKARPTTYSFNIPVRGGSKSATRIVQNRIYVNRGTYKFNTKSYLTSGSARTKIHTASLSSKLR